MIDEREKSGVPCFQTNLDLRLLKDLPRQLLNIPLLHVKTFLTLRMAHSFWPFAQPAEVGQMLCGAIQMIIVKHFHVPFLQTESIREHTHNTIYTSSKFMQILARVVGDDPTDGILLVVIGHKIKKHPRRISKQNIENLLILYNIIFAISPQPSSLKNPT